jgi:hypothetical protein
MKTAPASFVCWICLAASGFSAATIDPAAKYAYGANVGWIDLEGARTLTLDPGPDTDGDGIPDAWEYANSGALTALNGTGDLDGDGISDRDEYLADTDPVDDAEFLAITSFQAAGSVNEVTWPVKTTRQYTLRHAAALGTGTVWAVTVAPFVPLSGPDATRSLTSVTNAVRFYRVTAEPPLAP